MRGQLPVAATRKQAVPPGTAAFGEVVVLAVKGTAALDAVRACGGALAGKTVLDATNPIAEAPPVNGVLRFFTGPNDLDPLVL